MRPTVGLYPTIPQNARCDRGGRSHRGATGCALKVPRIARRTRCEVCELRGDRLAKHDRPGRLRRAHDCGAAFGDAAGEERAPVLRRDAGRVEDVLHADGDPREATEWRTRAAPLIGLARQAPRSIGVEPREGVDPRLGRAIAREAPLDQLRAGQLAARERVREGNEILRLAAGAHVARIVTRGAQPRGSCGLTPRILRYPARRNCASVPKKADSALTRGALSARG